VARYLFKLMAYKDEYEVARLHTDPAFTDKIAGMFEGDYKLVHHLAPPLLAKKNDKGELVKQRLRPLGAQRLRPAGAPEGPARRRAGRVWQERRTPHRACADRRVPGLHRGTAAVAEPGNRALAAEIARIPEEIRGYGHVKHRHIQAVRPKWDKLMQRWRGVASLRSLQLKAACAA
jgi:indolepyruvate ferredoxin oxidoreductase